MTTAMTDVWMVPEMRGHAPNDEPIGWATPSVCTVAP